MIGIKNVNRNFTGTMNAILILIVILLTAQVVYTKPVIKIEYEYYKIYGYSAEALRYEMNKKGVKWTDGKYYDAFTSWYVKWRFTNNWGSNWCEIDRVDVSVDVKFTLPEWVDHDKASLGLQKKWDNYYTALVNHENGHKDIGIRAAEEIEKAIANMRSYRTCRELNDNTNSEAYRILEKYKKIEIDYDIETRHGMKQGAKFP